MGMPLGPTRSYPKQSKVRVSISGNKTAQWDIKDHHGVSMRKGGVCPAGYNIGQYDNYPRDWASTIALFTQLKADGVTHLRLVGDWRWISDPAKGDADSYDPNSYNATCPANRDQLIMHALACESLGIWFTITGEGDVPQSGTQSQAIYDRSLLVQPTNEPIPGGAANWGLVGGRNLFTSAVIRGLYRERLKWTARTFRSFDYQYALEIISEPMPPSGNYGDVLTNPFFYPGPGNDGVYDSTWSAGTRADGTWTIEQLLRTVITDIRGDAASGKPAIDTITPIIAGGRNGYNLLPELAEVITAMANPVGLGGDLIAANIILWTWDQLGGGTSQPSKTPTNWLKFLSLKVSGYMNQVGSRNSGPSGNDPGDPNQYGQNVAMGVTRACGIVPAVWDLVGNGVSGYSSMTTAFAPINPRYSNYSARFIETYASLKAAAMAVATANGGCLFYVDEVAFSNVPKVGGGTAGIGDAITQISPLTDPLGTGLIFTVNGTLKLGYVQSDGAGGSYLPDAFPAIMFDGNAANYLSGNMAFFGTTPSGTTSTGDEPMTVIIGGTPAASGIVQTFLSLGDNGTTRRYPRINVGTNGKAGCIWQGDAVDPHTLSPTVTAFGGSPIVLTALKGAGHPNTTLTFWVNGIDDTGVDETHAGTACTLTGQTVSAIASLTRLRIGGTSNTGDFNGPVVGWYVGRSLLSAADAHTIGRFVGFRQAGGYKV